MSFPSGVIVHRESQSVRRFASYCLFSYEEKPVVIHAAPAESEAEAMLKLSGELEFVGERLLQKAQECLECAAVLSRCESPQPKQEPPEEKQVLTRWLNDNISVVYSDGFYTAWYESGLQPWGEISLCGKPCEDIHNAVRSLQVEMTPISYELEVVAGRAPGENRLDRKQLHALEDLVNAEKSNEAQE